MTGPELLMLGYFRLLDSSMQQIVIENIREAAERRAAVTEGLAAALRHPAPAPQSS